VRFVALSFFFLCAKCCPFLYRNVEVTANDKVGRFLGGHGVEAYKTQPSIKVQVLFSLVSALGLSTNCHHIRFFIGLDVDYL